MGVFVNESNETRFYFLYDFFDRNSDSETILKEVFCDNISDILLQDKSMEDFNTDYEPNMANSDFPFADIFIGKEKYDCEQNANNEPTLNMINSDLPFYSVIKSEVASQDYEMSDSKKIVSWINKSVKSWTEEDVVLWASFVSMKYQYESKVFNNIAINFCQLTGEDLCNMSFEMFADIINNEEIAETYYNELQNATRNSSCLADGIKLENEVLTTLQRVKLDGDSGMFDSMMDTNCATDNDSDGKVDSGVEDCDEICYTSDDQMENETSNAMDGSHMLKVFNGILIDKNVSFDKNSVSKESNPPLKKRPGRPPGSKKPPKEKKIGKLWENLKNWLYNPEYNPSIICWDDYQKGIFRFTDSAKAAKLWGKIKGNPEMTFEKMTRAMRYHYKNNVLEPYEKKLFYKFGEKAYGWQRPNPIL